MNSEKFLDFTDVVNYLDNYNNSLLLTAVNKNDKEMIKKLLSLGANINQFNSYGDCALTQAYKLKDKSLLDELFPLYQNQISEESKNALLKVLEKEDIEKYKNLYPLNNHDLAIFTSLKKGLLDDVKTLIDKGVSPNVKNAKGTPLLATIKYWSATQKLNVLKLLVDKAIDFSLEDEYGTSVLCNLALYHKKSASDKKIIPFLITHFNINNFTRSFDEQVSFLANTTSEDEFNSYFLNHVNEKNYKKINPSIFIRFPHAKYHFLDKLIEKIDNNNWNMDYQIDNKHLIYHFMTHQYDFDNKISKMATHISTKLDLNHMYDKEVPLYFSLLINHHDFDINKIDVEKMDNQGNQALSLFSLNAGGNYLLNEESEKQYSKPYFEAILNHPKSNIYHENKYGESFISRLVKPLIEGKINQYSALREEEGKKLKSIIKKVLKVKTYQANYIIHANEQELTLEKCLKTLFSSKQVLVWEKESLEAMLSMPNKIGQKIKI